MSNIERDLISRILDEQDLATVVDGGVTANYFQDYTNRDAFKFIIEHQQKHSKVPGREAFLHDFDPAYRLTEPEEPLSYYIEQITEDYNYFLQERGLSEAVDLFEEGMTKEALAEMVRTINEINREISSARVVDITETGQKRMDRYREYAKTKGALKGISSGFDAIDRATNGFQPKQLITMAGPPKAGKSTILLLSTIAAHRGFYRPLFIGFEMTNEEQEERHDALRAKVDAKALREGRLKGDDMRKIEKMHKRLELMPEMHFSEDTASTMTLSGVLAQIERYNPDVVFIDGVYLMDDENGERKGTPQALTNITRGLKRMAQNKNLCIVITTQVLEWKMDRKRGVTSNSIGYTSSFAQDSDCLIAVENTDEPDTKKVKVVIARNAPPFEVMVRWDWKTGEFEEIEDVEEDEDEAEAKF